MVGETGSGKSTVAKLLTRLMDPVEGAVLLDGVDVRRIPQESLRRSVVLVPQEGFLFDDTITANVRYGKLDATEDDIRASAAELGLGDWLATPAARASTPRSASAASRCPRASASWSRCSGPTSPTPTCWSSTRPPARSTPSSRCGSAAPSSG